MWNAIKTVNSSPNNVEILVTENDILVTENAFNSRVASVGVLGGHGKRLQALPGQKWLATGATMEAGEGMTKAGHSICMQANPVHMPGCT